MSLYRVAQGDCLSSIARAHGFADWQIIYKHDQNESFRRLRPDPNVIFPGDQLFIPDLKQRIEQASTDQTHSFQVKFAPVQLRVKLLDQAHRALAGISYKLELGGAPIEGTTGSDGILEQEIPPSTQRARLSVKIVQNQEPTGYTWDLYLGALDPPTTLTGAQARLNNLGYNTGPVDGIKGPRTTEAIKEFQTKYGLKVDGIVGPKTRDKLVEVHGC